MKPIHKILIPFLIGWLLIAFEAFAIVPKPQIPAIPPAWPSSTDIIPGQLIVLTQPGKRLQSPTEADKTPILQKSHELLTRITLTGPDIAGETIQNINQLRDDPNITYISPNYRAHIFDEPNDTIYPDQWHLPVISAPDAWSTSIGSESTIIAIVDTGADYSHPDLQDKLLTGYDFANDDSDPQDDQGHGTHVAGIAAAATNNYTGIAGTCWNCMLLPLKALDDIGQGGHYQIAQAIYYAVDHSATIINLSLGGPYTSATLSDAINYAWANDALLVAAAGNNNTTQPNYPAAYSRVMAIAATNTNNLKAEWSNYGNWITLAAPGTSIWSTTRSDTYAAWAGTSMAAPIVAGSAGLLRSAFPWTNTQTWQALTQSASPLPQPGLGAGLLNIGAAISIQPPEPTPNPSTTPPTATVTASPTHTTPDPNTTELLNLINQERTKAGLHPLNRDSRLDQAAQRHTDDMATNAFCSHAGSDGSSPDQRMLSAGYPEPLYEVIACGYHSANTLFSAIIDTGTNPTDPTPQDRITAREATDIGIAKTAGYWTINLGEAGEVRPPTPTPTQTTTPPRPPLTPTLPPTATPTPPPTEGCEIVIRDVPKRHLWHTIAEVEFLGYEAYWESDPSGRTSLGIIASPPAVCTGFRWIYEAAGYEVTP